MASTAATGEISCPDCYEHHDPPRCNKKSEFVLPGKQAKQQRRKERKQKGETAAGAPSHRVTKTTPATANRVNKAAPGRNQRGVEICVGDRATSRFYVLTRIFAVFSAFRSSSSLYFGFLHSIIDT